MKTEFSLIGKNNYLEGQEGVLRFLKVVGFYTKNRRPLKDFNQGHWLGSLEREQCNSQVEAK